MGVFDDISLEWQEKTYTIPANRVLKAIASVEDVITLAELARYQGRGTVPLARIASAYAAVLRFAGAEVEDEQVYAGMFGFGAKNQQAVLTSLHALMAMMVPPEALRKSGDTPPGNGGPAGALRSSRKRTKRRSAPGE